MRRFALILALASGCFYIDPINQRPSIAIDLTSSDPVFRGKNVVLHAEVDDPEGQDDATVVVWHAYLCTDATDQGTCDMPAFFSGDTRDANFVVPARRADGTTPVQSVLVTLDATDPGGAKAKPQQQLVIPISNAPPDILPLRPVPRHGYVVGTAIDIFASYGDFDDGKDRVTLVDPWVVATPNVAASYALTDIANVPQDPNDLAHETVGKTLLPGSDASNEGTWTVQVTAMDPLGAQTQAMIMLEVKPDEPPCITEVAPIVPPPGTTLPVFEPTLFQVPVVVDDLDVYPPQPDDSVLGVARFAWTIKPPGAASRQAFGTGNSVDFDPAAFQPGDIVEIRVEIFDRTNKPVNCVDSSDTCALDSTRPSCIQRQTWHVEVQ